MKQSVTNCGRVAIVLIAIIAGCATQRQMSPLEINRTLSLADTLVARDQLDSAAALVNQFSRSALPDTLLLWRQGLLNYQLESVYGRRNAARAFRTLAQMYPGIPRYHLWLAQTLIDQTREGQARDELYRTMDLSPRDETAFLLLADLYLKPFFVKEEEDRADSAEMVLKRLAAANPRSIGGLDKLGEIEAVRGEFDSARAHIQAALTLDSLDIRANLALGYVDYCRQVFPAAEAHFARALANMDSSAGAGYRSIEYLIPPQSIRAYRKMTPHERDSLEQRFWQVSDFDPTTSVNKRQVEHYARVWEANLCYSDAKNERIGWRTDMGETLIRLGRPDEKERQRMSGSLVDNVPVWFWEYRSVAYPCTLAFVDQMQSGNYTFPFPYRDNTGSSRTNASKEVAYINYSRKPEESTVERERKPIGFTTDIYQFRGDNGKTALLSSVDIARKGLTEEKKPPTPVKLQVRQSLQDSLPITVWRSDTTLSFTAGQLSGGADSLHERLLAQYRQGTYELATVLEVPQKDLFGLITDTVEIQDFSGQELAISDIALTSDSLIDPRIGAYLARDGATAPHAQRLLSESRPVYIYCEIYNLPVDIYRQTSYEISYTLQLLKPTQSGVRGLVSKLLPQKKESITTTLHEIGKSRDIPRVLALDLSVLREGSYELTVKVTDLIFGRSVSKTTHLLLTP